MLCTSPAECEDCGRNSTCYTEERFFFPCSTVQILAIVLPLCKYIVFVFCALGSPSFSDSCLGARSGACHGNGLPRKISGQAVQFCPSNSPKRFAITKLRKVRVSVALTVYFIDLGWEIAPPLLHTLSHLPRRIRSSDGKGYSSVFSCLLWLCPKMACDYTTTKATQETRDQRSVMHAPASNREPFTAHTRL